MFEEFPTGFWWQVVVRPVHVCKPCQTFRNQWNEQLRRAAEWSAAEPIRPSLSQSVQHNIIPPVVTTDDGVTIPDGSTFQLSSESDFDITYCAIRRRLAQQKPVYSKFNLSIGVHTTTSSVRSRPVSSDSDEGQRALLLALTPVLQYIKSAFNAHCRTKGKSMQAYVITFQAKFVTGQGEE